MSARCDKRCSPHPSSRVGDRLQVGVRGNERPFPEGSKIAKVQWRPKKGREAAFVVDVPATLADDDGLFFRQKDSKRFPETVRWGYAQFDDDPASATFSADKAGTPACAQSCHVAVQA
jgi:hypothetical protein